MDLEINCITNYLIMNREERMFKRIIRKRRNKQRGCGNNREKDKEQTKHLRKKVQKLKRRHHDGK